MANPTAGRVRRPNIVFVFADEWRAQATGYAGDANCETPVLDALAGESLQFPNAVAGTSVCCPYRASLLTGQYPLTHGVFINDVELRPDVYSLARAFNDGGYRTAYIGKWHVYGSPDGGYGRRAVRVPREYQMGFQDWWGFECTHDYWASPYYHNDDPEKHLWEGYDAFPQSRMAADYIRRHSGDADPFLLVLSWGPPHFPLQTAPPEYRARWAQRPIELRPNVPASCREKAVADLRGLYAHTAALDDCLRIVLDAVDAAGARDDTIVVFTSDHGDMHWSHGLNMKQFPHDESVRVPFLLRYPRLARSRGTVPVPVDAPDLMPTLLGLAGRPVPAGVEGRDWSPEIRGERIADADDAALLTMPAVFSVIRSIGWQPYRGLRTCRHTYVRGLDGPMLLFDNAADPFQMRNLVHAPGARGLLDGMDGRLRERLAALGDEFRPGEEYLDRAGLSHYREARVEVKSHWRTPWDENGLPRDTDDTPSSVAGMRP